MSSRLPLALLLVLSLAACGGSAKAARPASASVAIASFKYKAPTVHVRTGGRVTWANRDRAGHTATFTAGPSKLDTGRLDKGERATLTFPKTGRFAYVCAFHAFMKGTVVVDD